MDDALGNWQWLVQPAGTRDALVLLTTPDAPDWKLTDGFDRTARATIGDSWDGASAASLDCVAVPDAAVLFGKREAAHTLLLKMRRLLRPGGHYVGIETIHPSEDRRRLLSFVRAGRVAQSRYLRRAGFVDVRTYFVVQSPESPRHLVPDHPAALLAWDAALIAGDRRALARRLLYRVGMAGLVLRYRLCLARV